MKETQSTVKCTLVSLFHCRTTFCLSRSTIPLALPASITQQVFVQPYAKVHPQSSKAQPLSTHLFSEHFPLTEPKQSSQQNELLHLSAHDFHGSTSQQHSPNPRDNTCKSSRTELQNTTHFTHLLPQHFPSTSPSSPHSRTVFCLSPPTNLVARPASTLPRYTTHV